MNQPEHKTSPNRGQNGWALDATGKVLAVVLVVLLGVVGAYFLKFTDEPRKPPSPQEEARAGLWSELQDSIGKCASDRADAKPGDFELMYADKETLISLDELRSDYRWDSSVGRIWKWSDSPAGTQTANGSMFLLSPKTTDPAFGVAFRMGNGSTGFGDLCVDNLQIRGTVKFEAEGLKLSQGTLLIHPK